MHWVAHESRMNAPAEKGKPLSVRDTALALAKRTALAHGEGSPQHRVATEKAEARLAGPEFPEPLEYLWSWFDELDRTRPSGVNGPEAFTYPMIESWARLTGRSITTAEVEALLRLDIVKRHPEVMDESQAVA